MAIRQTRLVIKNNTVPSAPFSGATLLQGEAIVNTADGILMFSGITSSSSEWTPAGPGSNASFFEVGSNLYDLKLRNQIIEYQGQNGAGLSNKFLSGTTSGFVLADISDIASSVDSYVTGVTWSPNTLNINLNNSKPSVSVEIDSFTALTVNGDLFVSGTELVNNLTITGTGLYNTIANGSNINELINYSALTAYTFNNDVYVTGATYNAATESDNVTSFDLLYRGIPFGGPYSISSEDTFTTGGTFDNNTGLITFGRNDGNNFQVDLSSIDLNDTFVTGGTISYVGPDGTISLDRNDGGTVTITGITDIFTTGATLVGNTVFFDTNDSLSAYTLDLSAIDVTNTFVTGFTYNSSTNTFTISRNQGEPDLFASINEVSGLTINNDLTVVGETNLNNLTITGTGIYNTVATGSDVNEIVNYSSLTAYTTSNDIYATGFTFSSNTLTITQTNNGPELNASIDTIDLSNVFSAVTFDINTTGTVSASVFSGGTFYGDGSNLSGITNTFVTGGTISYAGPNGSLSLDRNDGNSVSITGFTDINTTGFTYDSNTNSFTITDNNGSSYNASISSVSGLTIDNLTAGRVVYVGTGGGLTDESGFEYNDSTNLLTVGNINVNNASGTTANIGQGGLTIGSGGSFATPGIGDLIVHGDLTVFGTATTVSTNELYIEDPQITLNYNPTADTSSTSVASGVRIQDGDGSGNDVLFTVAQMNTFTGGDVTEYTGANGYTNRAFLTQLNDIVIRNTNSNNGAPDGARVLAEGDVLDGGSY